jgi:hypothetical protein
MVVGVSAFPSIFFRLKLVPSKQRYRVPPTSPAQVIPATGHARRWHAPGQNENAIKIEVETSKISGGKGVRMALQQITIEIQIRYYPEKTDAESFG